MYGQYLSDSSSSHTIQRGGIPVRTTIKLAAAVLCNTLAMLSIVTIFVVFVIPVELPLSEEQQMELSAYAPEADAVAVFRSELWRIGHDTNISVFEEVQVERRGNEVIVRAFYTSSFNWDVAKSYQHQQRMLALSGVPIPMRPGFIPRALEWPDEDPTE